MVFISHTSGMPSHTSGTFLYVIDRFDSVPPCSSDIYGDIVYQAPLISGMHCNFIFYGWESSEIFSTGHPGPHRRSAYIPYFKVCQEY